MSVPAPNTSMPIITQVKGEILLEPVWSTIIFLLTFVSLTRLYGLDPLRVTNRLTVPYRMDFATDYPLLEIVVVGQESCAFNLSPLRKKCFLSQIEKRELFCAGGVK